MTCFKLTMSRVTTKEKEINELLYKVEEFIILHPNVRSYEANRLILEMANLHLLREESNQRYVLDGYGQLIVSENKKFRFQDYRKFYSGNPVNIPWAKRVLNWIIENLWKIILPLVVGYFAAKFGK